MGCGPGGDAFTLSAGKALCFSQLFAPLFKDDVMQSIMWCYGLGHSTDASSTRTQGRVANGPVKRTATTAATVLLCAFLLSWWSISVAAANGDGSATERHPVALSTDALRTAISTGHFATVERLACDTGRLDFHYDDGLTPLAFALQQHCVDCARITVADGVAIGPMKHPHWTS